MSREAMQMALDMLNEIADDVYCDQKLEGVITALRQALEKQEPVAAVKHIKTWHERCEEHPDHQERIISERMIQERMQEEIDELRQTLERERVWVENRHAAWHEGFEAGRKAERAFCAALCDEKEEAFKNYYVKGLPKLCAAAIRARGNT